MKVKTRTLENRRVRHPLTHEKQMTDPPGSGKAPPFAKSKSAKDGPPPWCVQDDNEKRDRKSGTARTEREGVCIICEA